MCTTTPAIDTRPLIFVHLLVHAFFCVREKLVLGTRLVHCVCVLHLYMYAMYYIYVCMLCYVMLFHIYSSILIK